MASNAKSPLSALGMAIWLLAAFFFLYEFFLRTFIGSVAHEVIPDLHLNAETFAIIGSAYYVVYALMQVPVGILADKLGVKLLMMFATLMCAGATYLFAHSTEFYSALLSRGLMGFGSSFAFVCLLVVAITWFPRRYFGFFAGLSQFIGTMGPLLAGGPLIALMADLHESWRAALTQIAWAGVVLSVLVLLIVKNKPREGGKELIFLVKGETLKNRLWRLAKNQQAWCVVFYSASVYISIALLGAFWGTEYLQLRGLSQSVAADMVSLAWLGYAIGCPMLGALSDISKRRKPVLIFCAILGLVSVSGITYLSLAHLAWVYGVLFFGLGMAASGQNVGFATIAEHVDLALRATALGLNNAAITLFGAIVPSAVSYCIYLSAGAGAGNIENLKPYNFLIGFSVMPVLYIVSLLIAWIFLKETYCKPQKEVVHL